MIHETQSPVISNGTLHELTIIQSLAHAAYKNRSNFTELCGSLELLFAHFDAKSTA